MLKTRVITALILMPIVIGGIFLLNTLQLALFFLLIVGVSSWEWARLSGLVNLLPQLTYVVVVISLVVGFFLLHQSHNAQWLYGALGVSVFCWVAIFFVLFYHRQQQVTLSNQLGKLLLGLILLPTTWLGVVLLHQQSAQLVLFNLMLIWAADSAAYFAGRRFGKTKLAPMISPGKTIEGVYGAFIATLLLSLMMLLLWPLSFNQSIGFAILCLVTVIFSVVGDLLESVLKRQANMKDSSQLLPGHGGVLDRVDSAMAAVPIFSFGWLSLGLHI